MTSLIDRDALIAEYDRVHVGEAGKARQLMVEAPEVDAVPVIRCKDCVHYQGLVKGVYCTIHSWDTGEDSYCNYGERIAE